MSHKLMKILIFAPALLFIPILVYIYNQSAYFRPIPYIKILARIDDHYVNTSTSHVSSWQSVISSKLGCLPIPTDLQVKAVPQRECDQPHILMNDGGRLGNNMCQYASLYLLRHLYGVRVSITRNMSVLLKSIFKDIPLPVRDPKCFTKQTNNIGYGTLYSKLYTAAIQARANASDAMITQPLLNTSYSVGNYPAPRGLLFTHRDLVRSLFKFQDTVIQQAVQRINNALKPFNATYHNRTIPIVTVHVRRTDYRVFLWREYKLKNLKDLYFKRAFEFYKTRLKHPVFLVVSDDVKWCKKNLQAKDVMVVGSSSASVDLAVISLGDHHVTSYGTYSLSGALLGNGHITHPINRNKTYGHVKCMQFPFIHFISRDPNYKIDNRNVTLT